jgi:hypothetical protein
MALIGSPMHFWAILLSLSLIGGAVGTACGQQGAKLSSKIGIVNSMTDGGVCLAIRNSRLKARQAITAVYTEKPQYTRVGYVVRRLDSNCSSEIEPIERATYYILRFASEDIPIVDLAVVGKPKVRKSKRLVAIDVDNDGKGEFFRSCTGIEGLGLTIWKGRPLIGKRLWYAYYYLKYDTVPTCKRADTRGLR